jgi:hypothetical protein
MSTTSDLDLLKVIVDDTASTVEPDGRWDAAERAVDNVLRLLYENVNPTWQQVYDAIKAGYAHEADWSGR